MEDYARHDSGHGQGDMAGLVQGAGMRVGRAPNIAHVYVDRASNRPVPIPAPVRAVLQTLVG